MLGTAAYLFGWAPGASANYGELIKPQPLAAGPIAALRGKWVLVSADAAPCDAYCERKLYFMRQVRRAQGKHMDRVERLWLLAGAGKPRRELLADFEGTHVAPLGDLPFRPPYIYLVDPLGNLMMRFPENPDPSRTIKDLQRLLKYSRVG